MFRKLSVICCLLVIALQVPAVPAQTEFKTALQKKYDFKTVSCYTCHSRRADVPADQQEAYKETPKAFRNDFGNQFAKLLKEKNVTKRLADVKVLPFDDPKRVAVKEEVTKEFLAVLEKVEGMKSSSGETYGAMLKDAKLDGVKPK